MKKPVSHIRTMLMVRSPLSRNCLQVTVERSSFCAAAGADTTSDVATSDMANRKPLMVFTIGVLNNNPGAQRFNATGGGGQSDCRRLHSGSRGGDRNTGAWARR